MQVSIKMYICTYSFFLSHFHVQFFSFTFPYIVHQQSMKCIITALGGSNWAPLDFQNTWIQPSSRHGPEALDLRYKEQVKRFVYTLDFFVKETQWSRHPSMRFLRSHSSISHSFRKSKIHLTVTTCRSLQITYSIYAEYFGRPYPPNIDIRLHISLTVLQTNRIRDPSNIMYAREKERERDRQNTYTHTPTLRLSKPYRSFLTYPPCPAVGRSARQHLEGLLTKH